MDGEEWAALIVTLVGFALVLVLPFYLLGGGLKGFGSAALDGCYRGLHVHENPVQGDVHLIYHTYRGFFLWYVQREHHIFAPPADAKVLLGRLLRYNLTWGMLSKAMLFVPFLAVGNYVAQKRSLRRQAVVLDEGFDPCSAHGDSGNEDSEELG
jgi:hypothetical protein